MIEVRTCEVKLRERAHSLRVGNGFVLLAANTKLMLEPVDEETWARRVTGAVQAVHLLSNDTVSTEWAIYKTYGDILCPFDCAGPVEEIRGFLECPSTGKSITTE